MPPRNRAKHNGKASLKLAESQPGFLISVGAAPSFDEVLLQAVDQVFSSLGKSVEAAIYFHLENMFGISKKEIPLRIADFSDALGKIFGEGSKHLELQIMKHLHLKLGLAFKWPMPRYPLNKGLVPEITFPEYVRLARQNFEAKVEKNGILSSEQ